MSCFSFGASELNANHEAQLSQFKRATLFRDATEGQLLEPVRRVRSYGVQIQSPPSAFVSLVRVLIGDMRLPAEFGILFYLMLGLIRICLEIPKTYKSSSRIEVHTSWTCSRAQCCGNIESRIQRPVEIPCVFGRLSRHSMKLKQLTNTESPGLVQVATRNWCTASVTELGARTDLPLPTNYLPFESLLRR